MVSFELNRIGSFGITVNSKNFPRKNNINNSDYNRFFDKNNTFDKNNISDNNRVPDNNSNGKNNKNAENNLK